jgi:PAS domain S-box-containing protein
VSQYALSGRAHGLPRHLRQAGRQRVIGVLGLLVFGLTLGVTLDRLDREKRLATAAALQADLRAQVGLWQQTLDLIAHPKDPVVRLETDADDPVLAFRDGRTLLLNELLRLGPTRAVVEADRVPAGHVVVAPLSLGATALAVVEPAPADADIPPPILAYALVLSVLSAAALDSTILRARRRSEALDLAQVRLLDAKAEIVQHQAQTESSERALRLAERAYQSIFDNASEGIFQTTLEGRYIRVNRALARIYGYESPRELIRGLTDIAGSLYVDPQRREAFAHAMRTRGRVSDFQSQVRRRDGTVIWISENAHVVRDETGEVLYYEGTVTDISARKAIEAERDRAREAAEAANRAKSAFLATISHELKTPLNVILGFSEILEAESLGPLGNPSYLEYAHEIRVGGRRLLDTINDVIALSQVEAGAVELATTLIDPVELVENALSAARGAADAAGVTLVARLDGDSGGMAGHAFEADPRLLTRMLAALIGNGIKFSARGGEVTVEVAGRTDGALRLCVADGGIGMSESQIAAALGGFQPGDGTLSRRHEGIGVGLALVRAIATLHGAELAIDSAPGRGTAVTVIFPAARRAAA